LTPDRAALLADLAEPLDRLAGLSEEIGILAANADLIATSLRAYCSLPQPLRPALPLPGGDRPLTNQECQVLVNEALPILESPQFQTLATVVNSAEFQQATDVLVQFGPQLVPIADAAALLNRQLPGIITVLGPLLDGVDSILDTLDTALVSLSDQLKVIGRGLKKTNVDLPTVDQVVNSIVSSILESPGGQNLTGGLDQIGSGVSDAQSLLSSYLAEVITTVKAGAASAGETLEDVDEAVVGVKAEVAGLVKAAHASPLPYGGDPANAPDGTVLAGAYEFRVDAADGELPKTPWRLLAGIAALAVGGLVATFLTRRAG
jgi:hypothetical protein